MIPGLGRSPGGGHGNPYQYSCLEKFMDRGAWQATVHGISKESDMTERLSLSLYIWKILSTPKILKLIQGLPWWLCGKKKKKKKPTCQCRRPGFDPWVRKIPWRRKWQPSPVFLSGKSHGQRILVGYSPWGLKRVRHDLVTKQPTTVH